jgi:hypothetical protein
MNCVCQGILPPALKCIKTSGLRGTGPDPRRHPPEVLATSAGAHLFFPRSTFFIELRLNKMP